MFDGLLHYHMSLVMIKPVICICENKDADQLRGNREADQRLCFRYTDSTIPLLPRSEISSVQQSSVVVQPGLCRTWSETPKTGFPITRLICQILTVCAIKLVVDRQIPSVRVHNRNLSFLSHVSICH